MTSAMRWVARRFGGLEVLAFEEAEVPTPGPGEVTIDVRAAGVNPADAKNIRGGDPSTLPIAVGYEVAGVISAISPSAGPPAIASGPVALGDEVLAFRTRGGYASRLTVPARDVFAKPQNLSFPEAANLSLVGATAADMLHVTAAKARETALVHGASGAVGVSLVQQARLLGMRVIGTASPRNFATLERFDAEPVPYGAGLEQRVRELAGEGVSVALDTVGTDEAVDVSLALVSDRARIVTIAAPQRAERDGILAIGGRRGPSVAFRDSVRASLIDLAARDELVVPVARTFPLAGAIEALELLQTGHPGGKLALIP
jgi:NADPH:quinone reductase-like Zn-dependent oxidoreductase